MLVTSSDIALDFCEANEVLGGEPFNAPQIDLGRACPEPRNSTYRGGFRTPALLPEAVR